MKYIHIIFLFLVLIGIAYILRDSSNGSGSDNSSNGSGSDNSSNGSGSDNSSNGVKEGFLNNLFSKNDDNKLQHSQPLTATQKNDNKSMNDFLKKQDSLVDSPIDLVRNQEASPIDLVRNQEASPIDLVRNQEANQEASKPKDLTLNTSQMPISKLTPEQLEEREKIIKDIKEKIKEKDNKDEKPTVTNPKLKADQCRFLSSQTCNDNFPVFMGASINGINGISCNDEKDIVKPEAVAQIENGEVKSVVIIKGGKGFESAPKVILKGDRYTMMAKAVATVNKEGEVDSISIVSGGSGYVNTPKVEFEYDENNKGCFLCCRLDLFN